MTMLRLAVVLLSIIHISLGRRCLPFSYATNGVKCGDNTRVEGTYCGVGRCNIFGTSCDGGCRQVKHLQNLTSGDVIMCTKFGKWKGGLALNGTHVVYPAFNKGFNAAIRDLITSASVYLGEYCRVETKLFDHFAWLLGYHPQPIKMDWPRLGILSFNWEYQVTFWKYGVAFSPSEMVQYLGHYSENT